MKLLIAIPSLDYVHAEFVRCLMALTRRLSKDGVNFDVRIEPGTLVHIARDKLALFAIRNEYTHVLWLDADMIFTENLLDDLMFSGKDFVTGIAHSRRPPFVSCVFKDLATCERYDGGYPSNTFPIAGCGFACVFMSVQILKDVQTSFHTCFLPTATLGEDLAFCDRAKYCNHTVWAEPGVKLGHIGHIAIYPDDHERWMASMGGDHGTD